MRRFIATSAKPEVSQCPLESAMNGLRRTKFSRHADYALSYEIESELAYTTARYCLIDTLGCGWRRSNTRLHQAAWANCAGTTFPTRARSGTRFELDPVQAAFNIGAMIRWLTSTTRGWRRSGPSSDNLGGILARPIGFRGLLWPMVSRR